jgi:putative ABC transport system substrate-binding protein
MEMKIFCQISIFLVALFISVCFAAQNKILIINTKSSILRYQQISAEFKKTLRKNDFQWTEFSLEEDKFNENDVQELIEKENPDFIYCIGSKAYSVSRNVSKDKVLLFSAAINWQRLGINDKSYGIANELLPEQDMTLLHLFFPNIKKIGILYSRESNQEYIEKIKKSSELFNIEIVSHSVTSSSEINSELSELLPNVEMLWLIADPVILENQKVIEGIFKLTNQQNKPVYAYSDIYIKYGAALSVSSDIRTIGRQSATLLMSLQQNNIPAPPVQAPAGSSITLNMCAVDTLKIAINKDALDSVNDIVFCSQK